MALNNDLRFERHEMRLTYGRRDINVRNDGGGTRTVSELKRNFNYFYSKKYPSIISRDAALIYLRENNELPELPAQVSEIALVNRLCLLPNPPFSYDDNENVVKAGYGAVSNTDTNGNVLWKLYSTTAYKNFGTEIKFDASRDFVFTNYSKELPAACIVSISTAVLY